MPQFNVECEDDMDVAINYMVRLCETKPSSDFPKSIIILVPSQEFKEILATNLADRLDSSESVKKQNKTLSFTMVCPDDMYQEEDDSDYEGEPV